MLVKNNMKTFKKSLLIRLEIYITNRQFGASILDALKAALNYKDG